MSIKTGLFFLSDFLLYNDADFWYYGSLLYYEKLKNNREKKSHIPATTAALLTRLKAF